jgi:hypothetical protein
VGLVIVNDAASSSGQRRHQLIRLLFVAKIP